VGIVRDDCRKTLAGATDREEVRSSRAKSILYTGPYGLPAQEPTPAGRCLKLVWWPVSLRSFSSE
jgi:hypothetical protein